MENFIFVQCEYSGLIMQMLHFYTPWKSQKSKGFQGVKKYNIGQKWVKHILK